MSMHFRETNTDPYMYFRKANTDPSMHFRKANTEFLVPALFRNKLTILLTSLYLFLPPVLIPAKQHHNKCNVICPSSNSRLSPLYSLCVVHSFFFLQQSTVPSQWNLQERPTLQNVCTRRSSIQVLTQLNLALLNRSHGLYTSM